MNKRDEILDVAEHLIRKAGYNAFSTRDVANAVGIKAASVHYYFPAKSDIGSAVAERYTQRFLEALGDPLSFSDQPRDAVLRYIDVFRTALVIDRELCLCAVLGAESRGLPEDVGKHARIFFERNLAWLTEALGSSSASDSKAYAQACLILAALEGAMILNQSLTSDDVFENVATGLLATI